MLLGGGLGRVLDADRGDYSVHEGHEDLPLRLAEEVGRRWKVDWFGRRERRKFSR